MDWPARLWAWCRNNLYHYGYFKSIYSKNAAVRPLRSTFESLGLKEDDVARLHEQFVIIDKDGSGAIELWELLDYLDLQRNRFAKRVFAIFDADGSNQIDFKEFVVALWQYCTLGRPQLVMFAFDLYDRDSSGAVWKSTSASGALLARSSGERPTPPRHRAGVASMAWRSTRRFRTNAP